MTQTYNESHSALAVKTREKFDRYIQEGKAQSRDFFQRLEDESPRDYVVATDHLKFGVDGDRIIVETPKGIWDLHRHALGQMVEKTGILTGRVSDKMFNASTLREGIEEPWEDKWGRDLLLYNLRTMYGRGSRDRVLLRVVQTPAEKAAGEAGQIRGFLSDRYRRMNSGPIFQAFAESALEVGAFAMRNHHNYTATYYHDTKCGFSMFLDKVFEPVANEIIIVGLVVQSSDFGAGALTVRLVMLRIQCVNMMVTQDELRKVHLGARLPDIIKFSQETYRKDTETMASAVRDIVGGLLNPARVNAQMQAVTNMANEKVDPGRMFMDLRRGGHLLKAEAECLVKIYNEPDIEMMPAGNTVWRAAQAISLFANKVQEEDPGRAVELRHVAGTVFDKFAKNVAA